MTGTSKPDPSRPSPSPAEQAIRMSPEQEQAAMADAGEGVEPADEGIGVLTDGDEHTVN